MVFCDYLPIVNFLFIVLISTLVPFLATWLIKRNCKNRHLSFRFISRKWIITIIPCAMIVYLMTSSNTYLSEDLINKLVIWAVSVSVIFLLGEHINRAFDKLLAIKFKDITIEFDSKEKAKEKITEIWEDNKEHNI